jgi:hypothetical protein
MKKIDNKFSDDFVTNAIEIFTNEFPEIDDSILGESYKYILGCDLHNYKLLYEGLTITTDIYKSRNILMNTFHFTDKQLIIGDEKNIIKLVLKKYNDIIPYNDFNTILELFNNLGWYPSMILYQHSTYYEQIKYSFEKLKSIFNFEDWNSTYDEVQLRFEAKFDIEVIVPKLIYHISPMYYRDKILKYGLVPKSKNKLLIYPDRIYFFTKKDIASFKSLANILMKYIPNNTKIEFKKKNIPIEFDVYEINTTDIQNARWFNDPNLNNAVYCLMNIKPWDIKLIGTLKIK